MKAEKLVLLLKQKHLTVGSVESMTAGLFSACITEVPGASEVFKGSIVTYTPEEKIALVGVRPETIAENGVVSWQVANEMAYFGRMRLDVDYCVAVTGNAGPTLDKGSREVGRVFIAIVNREHMWGIPLNLTGSRENVRAAAVNAMISALEGVLK